MYLLDTNVLSELRKVAGGRADPAVVAWAATISPVEMFLSSISIFEVQVGIARLAKDGPQARTLTLWLETIVVPTFADRIIAIDVAIARLAATLTLPKAIETADVLIAATARLNGMILATRNRSDFGQTGVSLIDPWQFASPT